MSDLHVSFEFFPPKTALMQQNLWESIRKLAPLDPDFVSVTYGAGGTTRERTHQTVSRIIDETGLPVAAHLTCVGATRKSVDSVLKNYRKAGVKHVVALRGDPPEGPGNPYIPHPDGYANAAELTKGALAIAPFEISVGCYPEKHPDSRSLEDDIDMLRRKIDAGATRAITQFFFDNTVYMNYLEKVRAAGINIPVVPGIMPVTGFRSLRRMAGLCGAGIPDRVADLFQGLDNDPVTRKLVAASFTAEQCLDLVKAGQKHFHFYTLNHADLTYAVCYMLGMRPETR